MGLIVWLLLCILTALLIGLPFLGFLGAGAITDSPVVAGTIAVAVLLGISVPVMLWDARRLPGGKRPWVARGILAVDLLLTGALAALLFVRPLPGIDVAMPIGPTGFWDLPTGSKIAFIRVPARGQLRSTPVIRIHGGPGIPDYVIGYDGRPNPHPLDRLAENGFDVYYYDQVGCGNSGRLSDVREYSTRRHVEDLEGIRQALGAERIVLIGLSWGSTLAAQYCAAYPHRVAKVVFESPGTLWSGPYPNGSAAREDRWKPPLARQQRTAWLMREPRVVFGGILLKVNPQLTARIVPESELARFLGLLFKEFGEEHNVCDPQRMPTRATQGIGAYAFLVTSEEYLRMEDPRAALSTNPAPALVIRGACEWLKPEVARDYVQAFPHSRFTEISRGGHLLYLERPEEYLRVVRGFLQE
jgi:proline iminopeptidase